MTKREWKQLREFMRDECDGCELYFKEVFEEFYKFLKMLLKKYDI